MLPKDSKKNKSSYYKFSSFASKNKKLENNKPVNKLFNKIKSARSPLNDNKRNINNNIHLDVLITSKEKDTKKKIHTSRYNTKSNIIYCNKSISYLIKNEINKFPYINLSLKSQLF